MDYNVFDALRAGFDEVIYVVRPEILEPVREHVSRVFGADLKARLGLKKQVKRCELNLGLTWFDEDIQDVVSYLNTTYYKF